MDRKVQESIQNLASSDDKIRLNALQTILSLTEDPVDWVYEAWDDLLGKLSDANSYQRSIGIMVLCNLAKSDRENRLDAALPLLLAHTQDDKFITSRQCIQNIWKVAVTSRSRREAILGHLEQRFRACAGEAHANLLRLDIIQSFWRVYEVEEDAALLTRAQALVQEETEEKYRKSYAAVLKA